MEELRNGAPRVRRAARSAVTQRKTLARESHQIHTRLAHERFPLRAGPASPAHASNPIGVSSPFRLRFSVSPFVKPLPPSPPLPKNRGTEDSSDAEPCARRSPSRSPVVQGPPLHDPRGDG